MSQNNPRFTIRPAAAGDSRAIRALVWKVRINPIGLNWGRFLVAVDPRGKLLGCGQIKPHSDGSRELASIAVQPEAWGQGIGSAIIERLLANQPPPLYLTCRASLGVYYQKFGFRPLAFDEMPPYFQRIVRLYSVLRWLRRGTENLLVMALV